MTSTAKAIPARRLPLTLGVILALAGGIYFLTNNLALAGDKPIRQITLTGQGQVQAKPDIAYINTGVTSRAKTARDALTGNSKAMAKIIAGLTGLGLDEKDIQTSNFRIYPLTRTLRDDTPLRDIIDGYEVNNSIRIKIRDLEKLGELLDKVVTLGANNVNGVRFGFEGLTALMDQARNKAVADARRRAELYAEAANFNLGVVLSLSESGGHYGAQRLYAASAFAEDTLAMDVPIASGEQSISTSVTLTWQIED